MSINSPLTKSEYTGNGLTTSFPITFEYTDVSSIFPTVDGNIQSYSFDDSENPTTVIFDNAPTSGQLVVISRVTEVIQPTILDENESYTSRAEAIEEQFDRIVQMIQEIDTTGTSTTTTSSQDVSFIIPDWEQSTPYLENQIVYSTQLDSYWKVLQDHTSDLNLITADIGVGRLELFNQGEQGEKGLKGDKGEKGDTGAAGSNGLNGAQGNDGIFSQIAEQAEAEAGVENTKGMTPLRTKQAIDAQVPSFLTGINSSIATINSNISTLGAEINLLKSSISTTIGRYSGAQRLLQSQSTPLELLGTTGSPLKFNQSGTEFVNVQFYIRRGNNSFTSFEAVLHYTGGQWFICRKETFLLDETLDVDGITLSVVTNGQGEGQVYYTATDIGTPFVAEENYIAWLGQEIPKGVLP